MIEDLMSFYDKAAEYLVMEEVNDLKYKELKIPRIRLYDELWKIGTTRLAEKYNTPRIIKLVVFRVPLQELWYNIV